MRIILLNPLKKYQVWAGVPDIFNDPNIYIFPPLGLLYLHAYLKKHAPHHEVWIVDAYAHQKDFDDLERDIVEFSPDLVGIMTQTHDLVDVFKSIQTIKKVKPDTHICLGGAHIWVFPEEAINLPGVDSAVWGDGEITFTELVETLERKGDLRDVAGILFKEKEGQVIRTENREEAKDLDIFPFPDRTAIDYRRYYTPATREALTTTMITSRGCPLRCVFCDTRKNYRSRSPKNIVDEMEICVRDLGIKEIFFIDDIFNVTSQRVIDIANEILARGLKVKWGFKSTCRGVTAEMLKIAAQAGCVKIHYGVETGTDEGLRAMNKSVTIAEIKQTFRLTREAKIRSIAYMMIGCPHEKTREDIVKTINFVNDLDPDFVVYALYSPYPDAAIFQEGVKRGLFAGDVWLNFMRNPTEDFDLPTVWEEHFSEEELIEIFKIAHRAFYLRPQKVLQTLKDLHSFAEFKRMFLGGLSLIKMEFLRPGKRL